MGVSAEILEVDPIALGRALMDPARFAQIADAPPLARCELGRLWAGLDFVLREHGGWPTVCDVARGEYSIGRLEPGGLEFAYSRPTTVAAIAEWLAENPRVLETRVRLSFEPEELTALDVYPGSWDEQSRSSLTEIARAIATFVRGVASRGNGLVYVTGR